MGTSVSFLNVLYINLLPFLLFSRRESPRSSTSLPSFLYGFPSFSRRVFLPLVSNPLHPPLSSLPFPFSLCNDKCFSMRQRILFHSPSLPFNPFLSSLFLFSLYFSLSTRVYIIIMCTPFPLPFPSVVFMFYNMFHNQPLTYLFSFYSKINIEIFCLYRKKAYFCIRLAEEPEPVSLTY